ncbi:hypothetical protein NYV49_05385 [Escherichia coli]|nr:hypothetical protein [Escherichia coli]
MTTELAVHMIRQRVLRQVDIFNVMRKAIEGDDERQQNSAVDGGALEDTGWAVYLASTQRLPVGWCWWYGIDGLLMSGFAQTLKLQRITGSRAE